MKNRQPLECERLERREVPSVVCAAPAYPAVLPFPDLPGASALPDQPPPRGLFSDAKLDGEGASALSGDAVGAFFSRSDEWEGLFPGGAALPLSLGTGPDKESRRARKAPAPVEVEEAAWLFLRNYARKAIRQEERARGPLPDHPDIIQQIYVEWREGVGPGKDAHAG